ncbi:hypothetical protein KXW98_002539 [Aspergillus fumigatus]|nr:hypothetical protein KXX30_004990 [Aspergillus fumigatus]KAH1337837.1 hypothetical protein KXX67_001136 [Aspergillus fumigatus]KAH1386763.1 hypothetical protein KXX50_004040 [Aspergillus fumigatus]KAH1386890.1 hypothetical protein KXX10_003609 [Aspergillus fumigatus]KAH1415033.1 hypothetical protein KXX22_006392 [Aspergillus fumigatus]
MNKRKVELMSDTVDSLEISVLHELHGEGEAVGPEGQFPETQEARRKRKKNKKKKRLSEVTQTGENAQISLTPIMDLQQPSQSRSITDEEFLPDMFHRLTTITPLNGPHANPNRRIPPAPVSFKHNDYLCNLSISEADVIAMQLFQGTYRLDIRELPHQECRMTLIWDYDHLWGCFDIGVWKGLMLIDPGPRDNTKTMYSFAWRGVCENEPEVAYDNEGITVGEITLGGKGPVSGCFKGMAVANFPNDKCDFKAVREVGPPMVPWPVETFVADWNYLQHDRAKEPESQRLVLLALSPEPESQVVNDETMQMDGEEDQEEEGQCQDEVTTDVHPSSPARQPAETPHTSPPPDEPTQQSQRAPSTISRFHATPLAMQRSWARHDQDKFLDVVCGSYEISSPTMKHNWSRKASKLRMRLLVDRGESCVWGVFAMGVYRGIMLFQESPIRFQKDRRLKFCWRGRETDGRDCAEKLGYLHFVEDMSIQGCFYDMYGDVPFAGRRRIRPAVESRFDEAFFKQQWWEHEPVPPTLLRQVQGHSQGQMETQLETQTQPETR